MVIRNLIDSKGNLKEAIGLHVNIDLMPWQPLKVFKIAGIMKASQGIGLAKLVLQSLEEPLMTIEIWRTISEILLWEINQDEPNKHDTT